MKTITIKKLDPMNIAKLTAIIAFVLGIIGGAFAFIGEAYEGNVFGGLGMLISFPIGYTIFGFMVGYLNATVANVAFGKIGGLKLQGEITE